MRAKITFRAGSLLLAGSLLAAPFAVLQAADKQGNHLHGRVRDAQGNSLAGAAVWVIGQTRAGVELKNLRTDEDGKFEVESLPDGLYAIRVSLPAYRPRVEDNLQLGDGDERWLEVRLSPQAGTRARNAKFVAAEDWRWVLRTSASAKRSVLRFFPEETQSASSGRAFVQAGRIPDGAHAISSTMRVEYRSSEGYSASMSIQGSPSELETAGSAAVSTQWRPTSVSYAPEIRFAAGYQYMPGSSRSTTIRSYRIGSSHNVSLPADVELDYSLDYVRLDLGRETVEILPSLKVSRQFGDDLEIFFAFRSETPIDTGTFSPDDIEFAHRKTQRLPLLTIQNGRPVIERIQRQEIGVSRQLSSDHKVVAAAYAENISNSALPMQTAGLAGVPYLPLSDMRGAYMNGGDLSASGVRVAYFAQWSNRFKTIMTYGYGSGLALRDSLESSAAPSDPKFGKMAAHTAGARFSAHIPESDTLFRVDYRWVSERLLTTVGVADAQDSFLRPYLAIRIQQPVPAVFFLPEGFTFSADGGNLLNQGSQTVFLADGTQTNLIPVFRSIRGGLAYSF